jgi:hypothetical protein
MAEGMGWQVDAVRAALVGVDPVPQVVPVLCFLNVDWPLFHAPEEFHGVRLESHRSITKLLTEINALDERQADALLGRLAQRLPSK